MHKNKFYITTAIPYVNASPHIGFALELVQADVLARSHRLRGDNTFFLTGADENSLKNVRAAETAGKPVRAFVDENTEKFIGLAKQLNISNDDFIRTVEEKHFAGAQKLWSACKPEDIYKKKYTGFYCVGCEAFYTEKDLVDGKCPEHLVDLERVEEENYFFKLSNYQKQLIELIESDTYHVHPESKKKETLSFIREGLEDFSISRSVARAKNWGVPVPGDSSQIMYVWFDALSNYITALDYGNDGERFKNFWPADVHAIGKGIIRFHAVYWPAMLLSAGIALPKKLFVHGYINVRGQKMSKSLGNVIDPFMLIENFGAEAVRYYLLRHIHPVEDSDYTDENFKEVYNADLANGLGNLVSRVSAMVEKYFDGKLVVEFAEDAAFQSEVDQLIDAFEFRAACIELWNKISACDLLIDQEKPWKLATTDAAKLENVLKDLLARIFVIARALRPFLPETAAKIEKIITTRPLVKSAGLFAKIDT